MLNLEEAKKLLNQKRYVDAARLLDRLIAIERKNDSVWYLRGLVSLKLRNYEGAEEAFEHALWVRQRPEYWRMMGVAYMESGRFENAVPSFQRSLRLDRKDVATHVFLALCYMFLNNPTSRDYIQRAYLLNRKKTKELLRNFYSLFFKPNHHLTGNVKKALEEKLERIAE